ncbi:MAG: peptide deformylase, partial [Candidatus Omnitrophica bacterium]|nr:peptide deformylase [Candidatus Omnitrophota bacterium]
MKCSGLLARVIQHETDHLNGKLIIDYASIPEKLKFNKKLDALLKLNKGLAP